MKQLIDMTDEELAMRYVEGDNEAFDILLERNEQPLFAYILFMVRDRDVANDVFQDTFAKIITKLHDKKYVPQGKFSAWCIRLAHNLMIDGYRSHRVRRTVETTEENDLSNVEGREPAVDCIEDEYVTAQTISDLKRMVALLPDVQREVVYMRYYRQLSFKEIAEITGVSINTSLGRMRYALINLRKMARSHPFALFL